MLLRLRLQDRMYFGMMEQMRLRGKDSRYQKEISQDVVAVNSTRG